jgi:soluble lytic murein transglycosylase
MKTLIFMTLFLAQFALASQGQERSPASVRVEHARELMGPSYKKSIVSRFENHDLENKIHSIVQNKLPKKYQGKAHVIAKTIIQESHKHGLDPYFVMAVIAGESSFNPEAIGPVGEIGMMQLRPKTGEWIAKVSKSDWKGKSTLQNPVTNIKLGVAYLSWLRNKFNGYGQLYLAAYNMGPKSVRNAVSRNVYPKDYPRHVMKRYIAFYKDLSKQSL